MSENKFIRHLQGKGTTKSVLEIRNQNTPTSFANMPQGTSNANDVYSDHRGDAAGVLKGTENWKLDGQNLVETAVIYGDGRDFTNTTYDASGNNLWVDATCTFATARRFSPNTKFVLKLCGHDLETVVNSTIDFTLVVKIGNAVISKMFTVAEQAFSFCKDFEIDFGESNADIIKVAPGDSMQIQLLCADANAQATIYNGMTVFTALQRRVDAETVASDNKTFAEVVQDIDDINEEIGDIHEDIDDLEDYVDDTFVRLDGNSIMTGPLKMRASSSFQCAIAPYWDGVGFFKLNSDNSVTLIASIDTPDGFVPWVTNTYNIGSSSKKWKNLYLAGKMYVGTINNGYDISVPVTNSADTFALVTKDINPLQQQINHLQTIGRFLSFWDATTGLAQTNPQTSPYVYQTGDYFRVGVVAGPGGTNYKPSGSSYTIGVASTTVETERLSVGQVYYYDGANWALAAGGSVAIDETTITFNNNDEIQAVAVVDQNTGIVKTWTGTAAEYDAIVTKDPDTEYIIVDDIGEMTPIRKDVSERNIGELVYSLVPIADSGLHLLDGNLLDGTGIYADFYNYMVGIQSTAPQIFCSESDWQTSVSTYGVCGKFVLDTANNTIRLPKITGFIEGTVTASELGALVEAGLPNITAGLSMGDRGANISGTGAAQAHSFTSSKFTSQVSTASAHDGWDIDASRSSAVYGNSNTVQPQSVKGYVYIVIANTAKTPVQVDIDNIATELNACYGHRVIEFQAPTAENNYTWYRKYADGWVEQGGCYSQNIGTGDTAWSASLPVSMSDNNYTASVNVNGGNSGNITIQCEGNTSTVVKGYGRSPGGAGSKKIMWRVEGMAA
jgi:hypothetical protein